MRSGKLDVRRCGCVGSLLLIWCALLCAACARERGLVHQRMPTPIPTLRNSSYGQLGPLAFLQGQWSGPADGGVWEEYWTSSAGGLMTGTARELIDGKAVFFEFSRIAVKNGKVTLFVSPAGRHPPTEFTLTSATPEVDGTATAQFENPAHDFPRVIRYTQHRQDGKRRLVVELEGEEKGVAKRESIVMTEVR
jgi:hypothetical protein